MTKTKKGAHPVEDDAGDMDQDRIGKDPSKLPGGHAGGAASAARPEKDRKASARKAAETRKRNQVTGPQDYTQEANKSALQIQREPEAAEELAEQIQAGDEEGLHVQALVEKADEDFVLPDGVAIEEDVDGDAATEGDETPEDAFEPADDEPAAEVLDNADAEEDLTDEEEADVEVDEPLHAGDETLNEGDALLEEADAVEEAEDQEEPSPAKGTRSKATKGGKKKAPAKKAAAKKAPAKKADTGKGTSNTTTNAAKRKAAGRKPAGRKRARKEV